MTNNEKTLATTITLTEQTDTDEGFCAHAPGCRDIDKGNSYNFLDDPQDTVFAAGLTLEGVARAIHAEGNQDFIAEWEEYNADESFEENARRYYDDGEGYEVKLFPCAIKHIKANLK